jgi:hypothetical protein
MVYLSPYFGKYVYPYQLKKAVHLHIIFIFYTNSFIFINYHEKTTITTN